jgi:hypothetical protein
MIFKTAALEQHVSISTFQLAGTWHGLLRPTTRACAKAMCRRTAVNAVLVEGQRKGSNTARGSPDHGNALATSERSQRINDWL